MSKELMVAPVTMLGPDLQTATFQLLEREFHTHRPERRGLFQQSITSGQQQALALVERDQVIGVTTLKTYPFEQIAPQLYLQGSWQQERLERVRLRPFGQLLTDIGIDTTRQRQATEIAYTVIAPEKRGRGYGKILFEKIANAIEQTHPTLIFLLARGRYSQEPGIHQATTNYLLEQEQQAHGLKGGNLVDVRGCWTETNGLSQLLDLDLSLLGPGSGPQAIIKGCQKNGFIFAGFSRNFSSVWCLDHQAR